MVDNRSSLSVPDVNALTERLGDRADAIENIATRDLAEDLRLAAKVIRALVRNINSAEVLTLREPTARALACAVVSAGPLRSFRDQVERCPALVQRAIPSVHAFCHCSAICM